MFHSRASFHFCSCPDSHLRLARPRGPTHGVRHSPSCPCIESRQRWCRRRTHFPCFLPIRPRKRPHQLFKLDEGREREREYCMRNLSQSSPYSVVHIQLITFIKRLFIEQSDHLQNNKRLRRYTTTNDYSIPSMMFIYHVSLRNGGSFHSKSIIKPVHYGPDCTHTRVYRQYQLYSTDTRWLTMCDWLHFGCFTLSTTIREHVLSSAHLMSVCF